MSIVSDKPQTTRRQVRGVVTREDVQIIFVDTPGLHKAVTALGHRVNSAALEMTKDVDVVCMVVDATQPVGKGDKWVSEQLSMPSVVVVLNKIDRASPQQIMKQLQTLSLMGASEYFPISAKTSAGVDVLVDYLASQMPIGEMLYPSTTTSETPEELWVAELVREQLLSMFDDELPYSIATRVTEWEWPRVRCEIIVERESQKGMVIGKNGNVLKEVGTKVRGQMKDGAFLELFVVVDKDWQQRKDRVERLGY